ncbi:MAG: hypothetical protein B7733_07520 [Myxococcales bacterium FL481]|nr:MAG: hypothetical protein B7733_07520 [Myxococcales bacterium FL481]
MVRMSARRELGQSNPAGHTSRHPGSCPARRAWPAGYSEEP